MTKKKTVLFFLLFPLIAAGCLRHQHQEQFSGTLEITEHSVGTPVPGRLVQVPIEESAPVRAGQLIATLERHEQAEKDYDRLVKLLRQGGTTEQTVELARLALEDQTVLSPVDGVVLTKVHEAGEIVAAGAPVAVIGESGHPWVRIFIPEGLISRVHLQQTATIDFDGLKKNFKGKVVYIAPQAEFTPRNVQTKEERVTRTFAVKVAVDPSEIANLHPGVTAEVGLDLEDDH